MEINSDLHCHPSLKGYGSDNEQGNIWKHYEPSKAIKELDKRIQGAIRAIARGSQTNLEACVDGKSRLLFVSIYPFERPFLQVCPQKPFKLLFKFLLPKKKYSILGEAALGIPREEIKRKIEEAASSSGVNYFKEYNDELNYLLDPENTKSINPDYGVNSFQLAADYNEYKRLISDSNKIVGILTVEGAHAFGNYAFANPFDLPYELLSDSNKQIIEESILQNIDTVKASPQQRPVPFFVTFSHHFNNLLAGHATSLSDKTKLFKLLKKFNLPGMRHLFNQKPNVENGISVLGRKVIHALLSRSNGRRILIDTKHMSVRTRKEFYQILNNDYSNDPIPIVHSHGAVNGLETLDDAAPLISDAKLDSKSFCSRWTINLTNEDIEVTFASDGLIGVCLHEGRMPGKKFKDQKKDLEKDGNVEGIKLLYLKLFLSNIFHIASIQLRFIENNDLINRDNWGGITMGSDYDGIVDPFDTYKTIQSYPDLRIAMIQYLKEAKEIIHIDTEQIMNDNEIKRILNGNSAEDIVGKFFFENADLFLSKYFTKNYLEEEIPV